MAAIYLKLDGVTGGSTATNFEGWIELESFSFGGSNADGSSSGSGAGKVTLSTIKAVKAPDSSSPRLFVDMASGVHISTGTISVVQSPGQQPFLRLDLTDVAIVSFECYATTQTITEELGLSCRSIQYTYTPPSKTGEQVVAGWDLTKNAQT